MIERLCLGISFEAPFGHSFWRTAYRGWVLCLGPLTFSDYGPDWYPSGGHRLRRFYVNAPEWWTDWRDKATDLNFSEGERCQSCGTAYRYVWSAPEDLWARVTGVTTGGGLRCIPCFDREAEKALGTFLRWTCSADARSGKPE